MSGILPITDAIGPPLPGANSQDRLATAIARWRWPAWIAVTLLLYYPIFFARPVFDDLAHVEFAAREGWHLLHIGPIFFRPVERILIGANWMLYGDNFWIVKALGLVVFALNVALVYNLAGRLVAQRSPGVAIVIATIFLLHPMNVTAVGKIDTFSEHLASLFALLIVRCALGAAEATDSPGGERIALRLALACAPLVFLGMLSKEAFAGIAAATPLLFGVAVGISKPESRRTLAWLLVGECLAALAYFGLRVAFGFPLAGAHIATARYQLHLGLNVPMNLAAELVSIAFPGSTLALFVHFNAAEIVIPLLVLAMFLTLFGRRLWTLLAHREEIPAQSRRALLIVLIAAGAAFFPTCLIPELISENQTALALPFLVLFALAGPLAPPPPLEKQALPYRIALACTCVAAVLCMAAATSDKVAAMRATSDRAYRLGDLILAKYRERPSRNVTVCFDTSLRSEPVKYSVFSMPDDRAALFQLTRLKIADPTLAIQVEDLRRNPDFDASQCTLRIAGASVTR
jgi:hypothetical protein